MQTDRGENDDAPRPRRRWLRILGRISGAAILVLLLLVSVLIANPFEGDVEADLLDLAPPDAPIFIRARGLDALRREITESDTWKRQISGGRWQGMISGDLDGEEIEKLSRHLLEIQRSSRLGGLALWLFDDALGEDVALAVYPHEGGEELDFTLTCKIGYPTKALFGSAELFGARLGLLQRFAGDGVSLTRLSSRHMSLEVASAGIPPLQIWRERDLLVVSSREDAIERVSTRLESDSRVRSLREQHLYKRVSEPLEGELAGDSVFAFLDCGLLLQRGIDLEALVTGALTQDGRAMALESIDFAAWRSAGVAVAAGSGLRARIAVALDPEAGERMKRLAKVYRERPGELVTPQVLPDGVAVAKTAALPFNVFFDLVFSSLTPDTRENVNYYVLDQLQGAASAIRPEYADLVSHLTACMGEEFTIFAVPSGFTGDEELVNYWPRVGVVFPTRNAAAVRLLIRDIARVLPQINPDLFSREENRPVERGDVMVFNVQSDFAPLRTLYQITPTFLVSDSYVALLSSSEMVDGMVAALHGEARSSRHRPPLAHGAFSIDSSGLEELLIDAWYEHRKPFLSHETTLRDERAEELLRERMLEEGVSQLGSTQLNEWRQWAYSIVDDPEEDAIIQEKLRSYLKPLRDAWIERAALVRGLGRIEVEATYSSTRLILSLERTPPSR